MNEIILKLSKDQRPIMKVGCGKDFDAMLDTGAIFPVWVADEELVKDMGARLKLENGKFGGFNEEHYGNVYVLPYIKLGDLIYPNFHFIACKSDGVPAQMLLPATMFKDLIYSVNDKHKFFTVTLPDGESNVRNLRIESKDQKLYVLCNSVTEEDSHNTQEMPSF